MAELPRQIGPRSVLFTDLVGSTELRVRLGEEGDEGPPGYRDSALVERIRHFWGPQRATEQTQWTGGDTPKRHRKLIAPNGMCRTNRSSTT